MKDSETLLMGINARDQRPIYVILFQIETGSDVNVLVFFLASLLDFR